MLIHWWNVFFWAIQHEYNYLLLIGHQIMNIKFRWHWNSSWIEYGLKLKFKKKSIKNFINNY